VVAAAILNGLKVVGKEINNVKLVTSGAGAAALACLDLLVDLGISRKNIWVTDLAGVAYKGRKELMDPEKEPFCQETDLRTLDQAIEGADIFLGLSAGGVLKQDMVKKMADKPLVYALANPTPEILPEEVKAVRPDAVMATGRTDYPNQVNNVLCFPFIFRGALDVGATTITRGMEVAAVKAVAELAQAEQSEVVASVYGIENLSFGPEYLIPKPFDPRLITVIAPAVAKAAMALLVSATKSAVSNDATWTVLSAKTCDVVRLCVCEVVKATISAVVSAATCVVSKAAMLLLLTAAKSSVSIATSCAVVKAVT
jgi:malate dehydrogenase (oxaloacetate-decarboxylating)(NADP+)